MGRAFEKRALEEASSPSSSVNSLHAEAAPITQPIAPGPGGGDPEAIYAALSHFTDGPSPKSAPGTSAEGNHPAELKGTLFNDNWDRMKQADIDRAAASGAKLTRGDLPYHHWLPRIGSYFLPDNLVRNMVERWEGLETHAGLQVDATDIFAGYAGIRGEPSLGNVWPEMYGTLDEFYSAYPELNGADVHSEAVGSVLARIRERTQAPREDETWFPTVRRLFHRLTNKPDKGH